MGESGNAASAIKGSDDDSCTAKKTNALLSPPHPLFLFAISFSALIQPLFFMSSDSLPLFLAPHFLSLLNCLVVFPLFCFNVYSSLYLFFIFCSLQFFFFLFSDVSSIFAVLSSPIASFPPRFFLTLFSQFFIVHVLICL